MKNQFCKVNKGQFCSDFAKAFGLDPFDPLIQDIYDDIKFPKRATKKSAGYDFFSPLYFNLMPGQTITIPTGIRVKLKNFRFLLGAPRSGLGFKYRVQLDNTIAVIDGDYCEAPNEGHIFAKITNDGHEGKRVSISAGEGFMQGIILQYDVTADDNTIRRREGGLGSTSK